MYLFCWTQRKIFWRMWETEQFWGTIDFHSFFSYYGSQWCPKTAWLQTFFKISSFVFGRTNNNNNNLLHLYSAFLDTQSALHSKETISSSTTNVQHPPGWCDGSHIAPERPPHTSLLVERRQNDEANQRMGMIRRPWWSEASGLVWPGWKEILTGLKLLEGE